MRRYLFLLFLTALAPAGCNDEAPSATGSTIRTSPLGYTANLSQQDASDLVAAGRSHDAVLAILNRVTPTPEWAKLLTVLILEHNEKFKKEVEVKNGPTGVAIDVWGFRPTMPDPDDVVIEWFRSDIEKAILPESWHKNREMSRAAQTITVYWTIESGI